MVPNHQPVICIHGVYKPPNTIGGDLTLQHRWRDAPTSRVGLEARGVASTVTSWEDEAPGHGGVHQPRSVIPTLVRWV
jgi:hypothetical protein